MAMRMLVVLLALMQAAGPSAPITSYYADTDFSQYHSYNWVFASPPGGMDINLYNQIHHAVDESLAAHGFAKSSDGDFAVAFTLGPRENVHPSDYGHYAFYYKDSEAAAHKTWINNEQTELATHQNTLAIDIYDRYTKGSVWHGVAPVPITPGTSNAVVEHEVDDVLRLFPPKAAAH